MKDDKPAARPVVDAPEPTEREVKELAYRLGGELPSSIDGPTLRRTAEALLIHYGYVSPRRHEHTHVQDAADVRRAVAAEIAAACRNSNWWYAEADAVVAARIAREAGERC